MASTVYSFRVSRSVTKALCWRTQRYKNYTNRYEWHEWRGAFKICKYLDTRAQFVIRLNSSWPKIFSSWRELPRKVHLAWISLYCGPLKVDRFAWISACNAAHNVSIVELLWKYFFCDRILSPKKFALFQTVLYSCCDHCAKMGRSDLFWKEHTAGCSTQRSVAATC